MWIGNAWEPCNLVRKRKEIRERISFLLMPLHTLCLKHVRSETWADPLLCTLVQVSGAAWQLIPISYQRQCVWRWGTTSKRPLAIFIIHKWVILVCSFPSLWLIDQFRVHFAESACWSSQLLPLRSHGLHLKESISSFWKENQLLFSNRSWQLERDYITLPGRNTYTHTYLWVYTYICTCIPYRYICAHMCTHHSCYLLMIMVSRPTRTTNKQKAKNTVSG